MKYLCLCYYDVTRFAALSPADLEAVAKACQPHDEALRKTGRVVANASLSMPEDAKTLRPAGDKHTVADGPFAATQEPLGAFFVIDAKDMDEALQIAGKHPGAHLGNYFGGGIEVRACDMYV